MRMTAAYSCQTCPPRHLPPSPSSSAPPSNWQSCFRATKQENVRIRGGLTASGPLGRLGVNRSRRPRKRRRLLLPRCNNHIAASRGGKHTQKPRRGSEVRRGNKAGESADELRGHMTVDTRDGSGGRRATRVKFISGGQDGVTDRRTGRERKRRADRLTGRRTDSEEYRRKDRRTERRAAKQAERLTDRKTTRGKTD